MIMISSVYQGKSLLIWVQTCVKFRNPMPRNGCNVDDVEQCVHCSSTDCNMAKESSESIQLRIDECFRQQELLNRSIEDRFLQIEMTKYLTVDTHFSQIQSTSLWVNKNFTAAGVFSC